LFDFLLKNPTQFKKLLKTCLKKPQPPQLSPAMQRFEDAKNGIKRGQSTRLKQVLIK